MAALKPDAGQIRHFLEKLANQDWVKRTERSWWPHFVFHYTHISNAVGVLQDGFLYSRKHAEENNKLAISSGSSAILAGTDSSIKECVRLYFRPLTPTQFHAEGIRSSLALVASKFPDAHCPVPVFFLFDSAQILARADCWFSDGGLGSPKARRLSTAADLEALPWQRIYHTGWFDPHQEDITFRRSAEVVVLNSLDLSSLRYIFCRSEAEKETLLHLLPLKLRNKYRGKIVATSRTNLFFRKHTFVQTVRLSSRTADFHFSPDTASPGPFHLRIDLEVDDQKKYLEKKDMTANTTLSIPLGRPFSNYRIRLALDEYLTYANSYEEVGVPF